MKKSTCPVVPMGQVRTLIQSTPIFRQFSENSYKAALQDLLEQKPFDILNDRVVQEKLVEVFNSIVTNYVLQSFSKPESLVAPQLQFNGMEYPVIYSTNTEQNTDITNTLLNAQGVEDAISTIINKYGTLQLPSSFNDLSEEQAQKIISIFEEMDFKPILTPSKYLTTQGAVDSTLSMNLFNQSNTKFSVYFPSSKISQAELNKQKALRQKQIYSEESNVENRSPLIHDVNNNIDSIEEDTESSIDQIEEEMNSIPNNPNIRYSKQAISVYYALLEKANHWVFKNHMPLRVFNVLFHTNLKYNRKNGDRIQSSNPRYRGVTLVNKNDKRMEIKRRVDRVVVLDYLSKKFNLKYQVVSDDYYKTLTDDITSECMIIGDTVYLKSSREDKYSPEQIIEEFLHPVVNTICKSNPELANKLIEEARQDFPDLISQIEFLYRKQSKEVQNEEIITQVLSKYLNKEISNNGTNSRNLFTYIKAFFEKIFNLFNKILFNEIIFTENDDIKIDGTYIKDVLNYEYLAKVINTKGLSFTDTLDSSEVRHHKKEERSLLETNNLPRPETFYEGNITPDANTIFVFGSNPEGNHGAGAAKVAKEQFGAMQNQGEGMQGNSYALPTKDLNKSKNTRWYRPTNKEEKEVKDWYKEHNYFEVQNHPLNKERTMTPQQIIESIKKLYETANQNPGKQFKVSHYPFGKLSLNGYLGEEMLAIFKLAGPIPSNVVFHKEWIDNWNIVDTSINTTPQNQSTPTKSTIKEDKAPFTISTSSNSNYADRTKKNIEAADITVVFAIDFNSKGTKDTIRYAEKKKKGVIQFTIGSDTSPEAIERIINDYLTKAKHASKKPSLSINIAGNGITSLDKYDITQDQVDAEVLDAIKQLQNYITISNIRSGGQTGVDEAGIKAGLALGIPTHVHAPRGFRFRVLDRNSKSGYKDIYNRDQFLSRFTGPTPTMKGKPVITKVNKLKMEIANLENYADILSQESAIDTSIEHTVEPSILDKELPNLSERTDYINYVRTIYLNGFNTAASIMENILESLIENKELTEEDSIRSTIKVRDLLGLLKSKSILDRRKAVIQYSKVFADPIIERSIPSATLLVDTTEEVSKTFQSSIDIVRQGIIASYFNLLNAYTGSTEEKLEQLIEDLRGEEILNKDKFFFNIDGNTDEELIEDLTYALVNCGDSYISTLALVAPDLYHYMNQVGGNNPEEAFRSFMAKQFDLAERFKNNDLHTALLEEASVTMRKWDGLDFSIQQIEQENPDEDADATEITDETRDDAQMADYEVRVKNVDPKDTLSEQLKLELSNLYTRRKAAKNSTQFVFNSLGFRVKLDPADAYGILKQTLGEGIYDAESFLNAILQLKKTSVSFAPFCDRIISYKDGTSFTQDVELRNALYGAIVSFTDFRVFDANYRLISKNNSIGYREALSATRDKIRKDKGNTQTYYNNSLRDRINPTSIKKDRDELSSLYKNLYALVKEYYTKKTIDDSLATTVQKNLISTTNKLQTVFAHMGAPFNPQQIKEMCPTIEELLPEAVKDVDTHLRDVLKIFITVSNYLDTFYDTVKGKKESLFTDLCSGYLEDLFKQLPYKRITSHRNSSFRYDNKSRQSYSSPDAIQLLRDRVQNSTLKDLKEYLNNEFGKYRFFQTIFGDSTNTPFSNPVLNDIYNGHTRLFDFVNILGTETRNGKKGPITRISAGKTENWIPYFFIAYFKEFEETGSTSSYNGYAHYRFPLLSDNDTVLMFNLPTYKYVVAGKDSVSVIQADSEHRSMSIYTTLRDMIIQEILRIIYVTNNKVELSKRFPVYAKKGQEFCFFPELNTLELSVNTADIGEEILEGTLVKIVSELINEIGGIGQLSSEENRNKVTKVIDVAINQLLFGVNDASTLENVSSLKEGLVGKFIQKYQDSLSGALTKYIEVSPVTTRAGKDQQNKTSRNNSLRSYEVELKQKKTNITLTQDAELAAMVNFYLNDFINQLSLMQIFGGDMAHVKSYEEFVKRFKQYYAAGRRLYPNAIEESQDNVITSSEGVKVRQEKPLEERCLYLEDAYKPSLQIANFTELLKNDNLDTAAKRVISDISDICTTDGQSFRTLSSVRKIFKAMGGGMWTKELEDAFNFFEERINDQAGANTSLNTDTDTANSKVSAQSISYLNVLLNAIKPMVSSYENITMPGNRSEKVIVQHKNSEYVLSALYSVLNVAFNSSPQLLALHAAMQDGNIDVVHFRSVVKRGDSNVVDINYDVAKFDAEVKANRGVILGNKSYTKFSKFKEALDKKLVSGTISSEDYTNYLSKYEYKLEDENGTSVSISNNYTDTLNAVRQTRLYKYIMGQLENPKNIHTIPLSDYMIIQPSGDHLTDQTALEGSQLRNIVPADLPEDAEIEVELTGLMIGGKPAKVKLSKASILKLYDALHCDSYLHDFNDLKKDFSSVEKLRDRLIKMTLKDEQWGEDSRRGLEIVDGTFKIPLASFVLSNKTNSLLFSMVKNSIQRQKVLGGNAVLASAFGVSDKLQIQWKEDSRGNKTIDYIPCMVAQSSMKYLEAFAESHPDGTYTLSIDKAKKVLGEDSPLFKSIAYRIPTEDKYSMFRLKIVGFMPQAMGSSIILPDEVVALSGTDFDIDKLFFMLRSFTSYYHSKKLGQEFSRLVKISRQITDGKEFSEDTFDIQGEFIEYLDEINTTSDSEYIKQCDSILSEIKDKDSKHVQTAKTNIQNRIKRFTQELNDIIEKAANRSGSTVTNFQINEPTTYNDLINLYLELTRKRQLYKECTSRMNPEEYAVVEDCLGDLEGTMYYIQAEIIRNYLKKFTTKGSTYDDFANLENQSLLFKVFMDYVRDSDNERKDDDKLLTPSFELEYPSVNEETANSFNSMSEEDQLNVLLDMSRTASDSARNNMLIDVCDAILTSKEGSQLSSITATFESLRETSRMNRILHDSNALKGFIEFVIGYNLTNSDKIEGVSDEGKITNIQLALSSTIKKLGRKKLEEIYDEYAPTKNPADIGVWNDTRSNLMAGNSLIGITAVNSSNHYKFQFLDLELAKPFDIVIGEGEQLNTITISTIDNRTSTIGSKIPYLIGKICAEYQAAAPDNGKDPTMGDSGISPNQIVMLEFLMRCGIPITYINLFNRLIPQITAIGDREKEWQLNPQQLRSRNKFTLNFVDLFNDMAILQLNGDSTTSAASTSIEGSKSESESEAIKEAYQFIRYQLSSDAEFLNEASNISRCDSANGALSSDDATVIQQVMKAQEFWKKATAEDAPIKGFENFINPSLVKEMMKESNYSSIFDFVNSTEAMTALRNKFLDAKIPRMQAVYSLGHEIALMMISEYFPSVSDTMIYGVEKLEKYIGKKLTYRSKTDVIKKFCNEFYAFLMTQSDKMFSTRNADGEIDYSKIVNSIVNAHQKVEALTLARADIEIGNTDAEKGNQNASMYSVLPHLGITKEGITISHVGDINPEDRKKYKMDFESMLYDSSSRIKVTTDNEHSINFASLMSDIFTDCFYTTGLQFKHNSPALYFSTRFLENMGKFLPDLRDCMSVFKDKENAKALMDVYVLQFIVNTPSIIPVKKSSVLEGITSSESTDDVIIIPSIIDTNSEVKPDAREFHALLQNKEYLSVLALTEYSNKTYYMKEKIGDTYILTKIELPKGFLHYDASLADDYAEATPINAIPQSKPVNDALAKALDNELIEGQEEQEDTDNNVYGLVDERNTDSVQPAESSEENDSNRLSNLTLNFGDIAVNEENIEKEDGDSSEVNTSDYFGERAEEIQGDPICKKS